MQTIQIKSAPPPPVAVDQMALFQRARAADLQRLHRALARATIAAKRMAGTPLTDTEARDDIQMLAANIEAALDLIGAPERMQPVIEAASA